MNLIVAARTATGVRVKAVLDEREQATGVRALDEEMAALHLGPAECLGFGPLGSP